MILRKFVQIAGFLIFNSRGIIRTTFAEDFPPRECMTRHASYVAMVFYILKHWPTMRGLLLEKIVEIM